MGQELGTVLIVDDESAVRRPLRAVLQHLGFLVVEADKGDEALSLVRLVHLDAVLLDINMPGLGGVDTCRLIRAVYPRLPILMLSVRDTEDDKVEALEAGADDYIQKPFSMQELIARLRSMVRRSKVTEDEDAAILLGEIELNPSRHTVEKRGARVHLTAKEFDLLHQLMVHAGRPVPHSKLLKVVWGPQYENQFEYLRSFVRQLRKKLEDDPSNPRYLLTDLQVGYRFNDTYSV